LKISRRLVIVAAVLGLFTAFAVFYYLNTLETAADVAVDRTGVVVAATTIPAHTRITPAMLEVAATPTEAVHPEAVRDLTSVVGGISRAEIVRGEQVLQSRVYTEESRATFSYRVPENMRAIAIPVNEVTGVGGYISAGDKVDVLVTYTDEEVNDGQAATYTVLQNVRVLATGELNQEKEDAESVLVETVTLAVTPGQAEVLAYFFLKGSFHLTLRSPADGMVVTLEAYGALNFEDFRGR
jgi:pilus assembly protein CpaB